MHGCNHEDLIDAVLSLIFCFLIALLRNLAAMLVIHYYSLIDNNGKFIIRQQEQLNSLVFMTSEDKLAKL